MVEKAKNQTLSAMKNPKASFGKFVGKMDRWAEVAAELEGEDLKQKIYDNTLLNLIGNLSGRGVLDYGAGPGVVASRIARSGGEVKVFDISTDMLRIAAEKLGAGNVYTNVTDIPADTFDVIVCNLVVCIVPDDEAVRIIENIKQVMKPDGVAFVGFCNPRIFDVSESLIDFRHSTGLDYEDNHGYTKTKKEGGYRIEETHRPIGWYNGVFDALGMQRELFFTPQYQLDDGRKISDFVIFKLQRSNI